MRSIATTIAFLLIASTRASAQAYSNTPEAEAWAETTASTYASEAGEQELVAAIASGQVNVYPGIPPRGTQAVSFRLDPNNPNSPWAIVVQWSEDGQLCGAGALHEWEHIESGHAPPGEDPTEAEQQETACNEASAHCRVLASMVRRYQQHEIKPLCSLLRTVTESAGWESLWCAWGPGAYGPPSPAPCQSISGNTLQTLPCTK